LKSLLRISVQGTDVQEFQGSYPFLERMFQEFFRTRIDFSRTPKCTIIEAIHPYEIEIQK